MRLNGKIPRRHDSRRGLALLLVQGLWVSLLAFPTAAVANRLLAAVPFESVLGGMPFFPVTFNSAALEFLLDTGGSGSLIEREIAVKLGLQVHRGVASVSGAEALEVGIVPRAVLQVGSSEHRGRMIAAPLAALEPIIGRRFEGILGGDFMRQYVVELNFSHSVMRLFEPTTFQYEGEATPVRLSVLDGIPFIDLTVRLPNAKVVSGSFLVDTAGGRMGIHVHKQIADREGLLDGLTTLEETGHGLGGATRRHVTRGSSVVLGRFEMKGPVIAVTEDTAGLRANPRSIGLVGMEILSRFDLTFDCGRENLYLEPNRRFREPFVYDASGLSLRATRPSFSLPVVSNVRAQSPAEAAGLRAGDVIVRVDSERASALRLETIRERLRPPGEKHVLQVERDGKRLDIVILSRELLD